MVEAASRARCCPFHTLVPREPVRPPSLSYGKRAIRQSPPGSSPSAEYARERAGGLVSTLTPRRVARRRVGVLLLDTLVQNQSQSSLILCTREMRNLMPFRDFEDM